MATFQRLVEQSDIRADTLANHVHLHVGRSLPWERIRPILSQVIAFSRPDVSPLLIRAQARFKVFLKVNQAAIVGFRQCLHVGLLVRVDQGQVLFFSGITHFQRIRKWFLFPFPSVSR